VDQQADLGVAHGVAFTIDLPSLAGQPARTLKERDRNNNIGGFSYYVLDTTGANVPDPPLVPTLNLSPNDVRARRGVLGRAGAAHRVAGDRAREPAKLRLTLLNTSGQALSNVSVCSNLAKHLPGGGFAAAEPAPAGGHPVLAAGRGDPRQHRDRLRRELWKEHPDQVHGSPLELRRPFRDHDVRRDDR
jgi:hypothetical protein